MAVERDVVVNLKVNRAETKAFSDVGKAAKDAAANVERMPKALTEASKAAPGLLAAVRAWALVEGASAFGQSALNIGQTLANPDLSAKGKLQRGLEQLPYFGGAAKFGRGIGEFISGQATRDTEDLKAAQKITRQTDMDQIAAGYSRQADDMRRSLLGTTYNGTQAELVKLRDRAKALEDKAYNGAAAAKEINAQTVARYADALAKSKDALDQFGDALKRAAQQTAQRMEGIKEFASRPNTEKVEILGAYNRAKTVGYENITPSERSLIESTANLKPFVDRERARIASQDKIAIDINIDATNMAKDTDQYAEELAKKIGADVTQKLVPELKELGKREATNQNEQTKTKEWMQRRGQEVNAP